MDTNICNQNYTCTSRNITQWLCAIWFTYIFSPHSTQLTVHMYMIHLSSGSVVDFFMQDKLFHPVLHNWYMHVHMCVCTHLQTY